MSRTRHRPYTVRLPHKLVRRLEEHGHDPEKFCQAAVVRAAREVTRPADPDANFFDRTERRALARSDLGLALKAARLQLGLRRRQAHAALHPYVEADPDLDWMDGWSLGSYQAWEVGRSAPPSVAPFIAAFHPSDSEAQRWTRLWSVARIDATEVEGAEEEEGDPDPDAAYP